MAVEVDFELFWFHTIKQEFDFTVARSRVFQQGTAKPGAKSIKLFHGAKRQQAQLAHPVLVILRRKQGKMLFECLSHFRICWQLRPCRNCQLTCSFQFRCCQVIQPSGNQARCGLGYQRSFAVG